MTRAKPLWTCPRCRHRFVTRNTWHSCGRHILADRFRDTDPVVRPLLDRFRSLVRVCGPVTIYAQKTQIVCQRRVRFAGVVTRRQWINVSLWLPHRAAHPQLRRVERFPDGSYGHTFRFRDPREMDRYFETLLAEAYLVGQQEHLRRSPRSQQR